MSNPLAGVASIVDQLAQVWKGGPLITPPKTYTPNRQQRRHMRQPKGPSKAVRANNRAAAQRAGYAAGRAGLDHREPGTCPYQTRALIDAWSAGYVDGKRKRGANP